MLENQKSQRRKIGFLGHQVKTGHIKLNPENIRALMETQIPTTEEETCRFLKGGEYYRNDGLLIPLS
ncbi:unnamed protein product [Didymodactylos carnosus]|uniref:Uncharacterized protein n=1 Tax=Didymodactylos carnosus TaxID=1234261 RepID=A0A815VHT9_9BILA|nr:unnamed protein product [Didymodactylos carnosus]CAF1528459.1 unnamed protein product [Didymodactylos carnosus]CAF4033170.1 unnamed protein product [Didymodactylos carnosus]CAF4387623.1 unnamed protein product [Didymodactylos carnosus]